MKYDCDVVIVGTGAAGLFCALHLPETLRVTMISKKAADASDSFLAQGGICVMRGEEDYGAFFEDTLKAGHYKNDEKAVQQMVRFSGSAIQTLLRLGVRFERGADESLTYTKEGGHSRPRILYHKDISGKEITETLLRHVRAKPNVTIREYVTMLDLISADNSCGGIVITDENGRLGLLRAPVTVLCSGGLGGLYTHSTNYSHITGDAVAIALRRGIALQSLSRVQIHPTTFYTTKPGRRFLISEAVRGEGAVLYNRDFARFTDELQPRDKLSEAIWAQMEQDGTDHVWEDMRPIGEAAIRSHFPSIQQHCLEQGINVLTDLIPVVPAQHYFMGGIKVNLGGQTSMQGLYACGETSCNGVHGHNRLASNSLLEALVFSQRAAEDIAFGIGRGAAVIEKSLSIPVDLAAYEDQDALFAGYKKAVLDAIERSKTQ